MVSRFQIPGLEKAAASRDRAGAARSRREIEREMFQSALAGRRSSSQLDRGFREMRRTLRAGRPEPRCRAALPARNKIALEKGNRISPPKRIPAGHRDSPCNTLRAGPPAQ